MAFERGSVSGLSLLSQQILPESNLPHYFHKLELTAQRCARSFASRPPTRVTLLMKRRLRKRRRLCLILLAADSDSSDSSDSDEDNDEDNDEILLLQMAVSCKRKMALKFDRGWAARGGTLIASLN